MDFSEYQVQELGKPVLLPAFCITLFTNVMVSRDEIPNGLLKPYHKILQDLKQEFRWASYDFDQKWPKKVTEDIFQKPDHWLAKPSSRSKDSAFISLFGGNSPQELHFPFFSWDYTNNHRAKKYDSSYRIDLPLSWKNNLSATEIDDYIYHLVEDYPLVCGYAGYTISGNSKEIMTRDDLKEYIFHWHQRHPGIMNTVPLSESQILTQGNILFAVGWITILGEDLCKRMGGFEELYLKLSHITNIVVKPLPQNGALIRIGDKPRLGDLYNGGLLDTYQAVGQVLFPISVHDFHALAKTVVVEGFHDNNECAKWLGRFFPDWRRDI